MENASVIYTVCTTLPCTLTANVRDITADWNESRRTGQGGRPRDHNARRRVPSLTSHRSRVRGKAG
jgi:hypothetical protein